MLEPLARFIDWSVIQAASFLLPRLDMRDPHLEETLKILNAPDFISAESQPAKVEFSAGKAGLHFTFPTPRPSAFKENNLVHGRLYRCAGRWQERPTIILLHGASDFFSHKLGFPWIARKANRAGFNAATLVAPYHFQRRTRRGILQEMDGPEAFVRFAELFAMGVAEIRALTSWLLEQGCPSVALCGGSMGGWLAGLTVAHDARVKAAVMVVPGVCMNLIPLQAEHSLSRHLRETIRGLKPVYDALDRTSLNLLLSWPVIPGENILLVEGKYDLMVASALVEKLWETWGRPEIWRLPRGHISTGFCTRLPGRILHWLKPRLTTSEQATL